ncbi:MAG: lysophospholipid acyltransferase family protein [Pseudomonadota bacterium]
MILALRSVLFTLYMVASGIIAATVVFVGFWAPYRFKWWITVAWCRGMVWAGSFFCGLKVEVEGRENIPDEASVIMIKHTTTLETYWHVTVFPRTSWVVKRELLWIPMFGWAIAFLLQPIGINRSAGRSAAKQVIEMGTQRLKEGVWVTIFPEGTRMPPAETRRYGTSGAALAQAAGVKIVPVAHNAGDFWPRRGFFKRPGKVRIRIGEPMDAPADKSPKQINLDVQRWIEGTMLEISDVYKATYGDQHPLNDKDFANDRS